MDWQKIKGTAHYPLLEIYSEEPNEIPDFIIRLANTPPMQRLKKIGMNCGCEYVALHAEDMCRRYTRLEHSVGVALIVWHFTHDVKQSVAGLFHDISTPAFAHVVDFFNGDHLTQESTEEPTAAMIENSPEIQTILAQLGLTTADVCDYHRYPIADNASPQLSADRLEYTLGNFIQYGVTDEAHIKKFYRAISVGENEHGEPELVFMDKAIAEEFALCSMRCAYVYISASDRFTMQFLADGLKRAAAKGLLTVDDLYTTEENVIEKLQGTPETAAFWQEYTRIQEVRNTPEKVEGQYGVQVNAKRRYLDPYVPGMGRVTTWSESYRAAVEAFLSVSFAGWLSIAQ